MAPNIHTSFDKFHRGLLDIIQARDGSLAANANLKADGAVVYIEKYRESVKTTDRGNPFRYVTLVEARRMSPLLKKMFSGRINFWDALQQQRRSVFDVPNSNEVAVSHIAREVKVFALVASGKSNLSLFMKII